MNNFANTGPTTDIPTNLNFLQFWHANNGIKSFYKSLKNQRAYHYIPYGTKILNFTVLRLLAEP